MQPALSIVRSWSVSVSRGDWVAAHDDEAVGGVGVGVGVGAASSAVFWTSAFSPKDGCRCRCCCCCCCCCCCACGAFSQKATPKPPSAFDGLVTRWKEEEEEEGAAPLLLAPASGVSKPSERSAAPKLASTSAGRSVPSAETHSARSTMAVGHNGAPAACSSFVYAAFEEMVSLNVADG